MAAFKRFEEIEAWQKARELTRLVYDATAKGDFARDFALRDQIRRAAVSVMPNIAEGFGRGGNREFVQFLSMAVGSANEVCAQLYVALDQKYITEKAFGELVAVAQQTARMTTALAKYLQASEFRGRKFMPSRNREP